MPTQNVSLSAQQSKFIRQGVHSGRYRNASEVVRAGLRLLEQQEREEKLKLQTLRKLASQAFEQLDRGQFVVVEPDGIDDFVESIDAKARSRSGT